MSGWMMVVTIVVPIFASTFLTAIIALLIAKSSDNKITKSLVDSTGSIIRTASESLVNSTNLLIEAASVREINCIQSRINEASNEIKELGVATIRIIEANGKIAREANSDESRVILKAIEAETSGLVKVIEALAKKN